MNKFLFELLTEEIPAFVQINIAKQFEGFVYNFLHEREISFASIQVLHSPRRLALIVEGLPKETKAIIEEIKGPQITAPKEAIEGFLAKYSITLSDCKIQEMPKGEFYIYKKETKGIKIEDAMPLIIQSALAKIKIKKIMMWENNSYFWSRPVRNVLFVFNNLVMQHDLFGLSSTGFTKGHRFLGQEEMPITDVDSYIKVLEDNFVIVEQKRREQIIEDSVKNFALKNNLIFTKNSRLFKEIAGLVEYPVFFAGEIEEKFLQLPQEVLINIMSKDQKYINFCNKNGSISKYFVAFANNAPEDMELIQNGNQRVLKSRLEDGMFFYNQDLNKTINSMQEDLHKVMFFESLGTMEQKSKRNAYICSYLADVLKQDVQKSIEIAKIAKADLVSNMVKEISDLQGIMGGYYLASIGKDEIFVKAVQEHYNPQGLEDIIPSNIYGQMLAIADKMDYVVSLFAIGKKPTGSGDPLALRRAVLGVIRILIESKVNINLNTLIDKTMEGLKKDNILFGKNLKEDVLAFFGERMIAYFKEDFSKDEVNSILKSNFVIKNYDVYYVYDALNVLNKMRLNNSFKELEELFKRAYNFIKDDDKKELKTEQITGNYAKDLYNTLKSLEKEIVQGQNKIEHHFEESLQSLIKLKTPLYNFIENTKIRDGNNSNIALLQQLSTTILEVIYLI